MRKRWELITDASSPVRNSVANECGVSRSTEKWLCQFPRNDLVVLLDIALHYFTSRINWVNKTTNKKEIIKTICDSGNNTCFPTRLSASVQQSYKGWSCRNCNIALLSTEFMYIQMPLHFPWLTHPLFKFIYLFVYLFIYLLVYLLIYYLFICNQKEYNQ